MIADHFKLVIFDCDGALVDSEPIINQAHAHELTACGYPITEQNLVDRFCGMSDREMLQIIERQWDRALPTSYAEHVGSMIEAGFRQSLAPIEGVTEAIDSLTLPICVAPSSSLEQIRQKLKITGLLGRFGEHLFSATMVARGKPAPDLFLYAAQHLTTAPDSCLVIEDSPAGIDAALAAGMTAIGFSGGSHCGPEHGARLEKHGAPLVIDDMAARSESNYACVRIDGLRGRRERQIGEGAHGDRYHFPVYGGAPSTRSTRNAGRSRR